MGKVCWDFPLLGTGNESGNNIAAITMFKGTGIMDGLAREVCQNSLDAKNKDLADVPVKVKFEMINIPKKEYEMFSEYEKYLDQSIEYWNKSPLRTSDITDFLNNVKQALNYDEIPVLVMSDYNTEGLNGVNARDDEQSFWKLLVDTEGISIKQDKNSAGSFGIGKNAPFAYSALNLVLYNTLAKDGGRAFEGVTRLVTTQKEHDGKLRKTQPIGKYLYLEDEYTGRPILPEDACKIANIDIFKRNEVGTDVAVVGFKRDDYLDWEKNIAIATIKNFILAIMDGKLDIVVKSPKIEYHINQSNIEELLYQDFANIDDLRYTRQIFETITKGEKNNFKIVEADDLTIFVKENEGYRASVSRFRSTGMLINTTSEGLPRFSVVVIVNDVGEMILSQTLRKAEPPQHTEWKAKNITDNRELHNKAAKYIRNINKKVKECLEKFENSDIRDRMDAGIGNFLPDISAEDNINEGNDGLKTDVKIREIVSYDGRVFYDSRYDTAETSDGKHTSKTGIKTGKKKHKKREDKPIQVVKPEGNNEKGIAPGRSNVRIVTPKITEHRTFYVNENKYRLYINSPEAYNKVFVQYYAGRDDEKQEALIVKNIKSDNFSMQPMNKEKIGPISLKEGANILDVEFENSEIMAVIPVFTMEVSYEK